MKGWVFFIGLIVLTSCRSGVKKMDEEKKKELSASSLFNLSTIYSDAEQNISFPIWFNDSMIQEKGITNITRLLYDESLIDTTETIVVLPKKKYNYHFDKAGYMSEMMVSNFYDDKIISTIKILFSKHDPITGFSATKINDELAYDKKEFPYVQMNLVTSEDNKMVFKEVNGTQKIFILTNEKDWKPLKIDRACRPSKNDLIILGDYPFPTKKYKVQNIVEEMDVKTYTRSEDKLLNILWQDAPFEVKRTFEYDPNGHCIGFIDSTFSISNYVSSMHYRIESKDGLPIAVTRSVFRDKKEFVLFRETFEYTYKD